MPIQKGNALLYMYMMAYNNLMFSLAGQTFLASEITNVIITTYLPIAIPKEKKEEMKLSNAK